MNKQQSLALLERVSTLLAAVDAAAKEEHAAAGGDLQGWDNRIILAAGLPVTQLHNARRGVCWVSLDFEPILPDFSEGLTWSDGALWGEESEEYGTACEYEYDLKAGLSPVVFWLQSGTSNLPSVGEVDGGEHYHVRASVDGAITEFRHEMTDAEISGLLRECFSDTTEADCDND